jgi:small-conductance mechanosensitive channel
MVHVPNATLFSQVVINCTHQKKADTASYILDEALFRVTFDSDWDTVEKILLDTAYKVTKNIVEATGTQPYVRADTWEYGTLFRLRYMTAATDRPRLMYEIVKNVTKEIQKNMNVDLAIPYVYSFNRGMEGSRGAGPGHDEKVEDIEISNIQGYQPDEYIYQNENDPEILKIAGNITEVGLLQPIIVARDINSGKYNVVLGEKRLKACIILHWKKVPAIVRNPIGIDININKNPIG